MKVLKTISPDLRLGCGLVGFCLLAVEANRPGWVLPGAVGVLLILLTIASFGGEPVHLWAVLLLLLASSVLLLNLRFRVPNWLLVLATCCLPAGLIMLLPAGISQSASLPVAGLGGLTVGALAAVLSRIAFRARMAKRVH